MKRPQIVNRIKNVFSINAPDTTLILYGSEARGDATPESDIDLLILVHRNQERLSLDERLRITEPLYDIELETGVAINSMVVLEKEWRNRPIKTPFYINVMNDGIIL